ncbi:hypothetical protein ABQE44_25360 [Mycolicibacterium sp. XJ2546]
MNLEYSNVDPADDRDPIAAAFADYRRPEGKRVARPAEVGDITALAGKTVAVEHDELFPEHGLARHTEPLTVTRPVLPKGGK